MNLKAGDSIKCFTGGDMAAISDRLTEEGYTFRRRGNFIIVTGVKRYEGCSKRLSALRKNIYFTPEEVAEEIGIPVETYNEWESGEALPSGKAFKDLCYLMETTPEYILEGKV